MKLQILAACAALVSLSAGSALAADPITAKLSSPVAANTKFIAGGAMFKCEADLCVALAPTSTTYATSTCKTSSTPWNRKSSRSACHSTYPVAQAEIAAARKSGTLGRPLGDREVAGKSRKISGRRKSRCILRITRGVSEPYPAV